MLLGHGISPGALPQANVRRAFGADHTFSCSPTRRFAGSEWILTLRQHRSWRRGASSDSIALLPPVAWDRFHSGYRGEIPSVPCLRRARNFEADTCERRATIAPCQRPAWDPLDRRVGF